MSVAEARARLNRAIKNTLNDEDRAALSTAHPRFTTATAAAKYDLEKAIQRGREAKAQEKQDDRHRQVTLFETGRLPGSGEAQVANGVLRGSLFSAGVIRGKRQYLKNHPVTDWAGVRVAWSGAQLDQADLDVALAVLRVLERETEDGTVEDIKLKNGRIMYSRVRCSVRGLLRDMGRRPGGSGQKWLGDALDRLKGGLVFKKGRVRVSGAIIPYHSMDDAGDVLVVDISRAFIKVFAHGFTRLDWGVRLSLPDSFAKWLHGHICTHEPGTWHYRTTEDLMEQSGSHYTRNRIFREQRLRPALQALLEAGELSDFSIRGDAVGFRRPGPAACG